MSHNLDEDTPEVSALVIPAKLPPGNLVLVDQTFMGRLIEMEAQVASFKITDHESAQAAADLQKALTKAGTGLDAARLALLRPILDTRDAINGAAANATARIELSKRAIKSLLTAYQTAQEELAAAKERARWAEEQRLERERQAEIRRLQAIEDERVAEANRQAAALLKRQAEEAERAAQAERERLAALKPAPAENLDDDEPHLYNAPRPGPEPLRTDIDLDDISKPPVEKTEDQKRLEQLKFAPVPAAAPIVAPKIAGTAFRTTVEIVSTDIDQLPEAFVTRTVNLKAIRDAYTVGWKAGSPLPVCPGVVFQIKREPITR